MADEKISQLADSGAPQDTDQLVIARAGSNFSLLISALKAAIPGGVNSVFTRTGAVVAQTGDYTAAQVGALPSTETLDQIATANATAANVTMNSHKITNLTNGSGAQDAAAFGQIPTALPPNGTAGGDLSGTYPNPKVAKLTETSGPTDLTIGTVNDGEFLKRSGATIVSGAAGGSGTVTSVTSADTSISVATTTTTPVLTVAALNTIATNHATSGDVNMNSHKITNVTDPAAAQDAATKNYVDTNLPGNAGGKGHLTTATAVNAPADLAPGADGTILTANSGVSTGIAWAAAPGLVKLFEQTLSGAASTIDTGANAIPAGHGDLIIYLMGRLTDAGVAIATCGLRFNGDGNANYDFAVIRNHLGTSSSVQTFATTAINFANLPAATATANFPGAGQVVVPAYDATTFFKVCTGTGGGTGASSVSTEAWTLSGTWRSTTAINQVTVTDATGGNFAAGSRLVVYGAQ